MNKFSEKDVVNYADGQMEASEIKAFEEALNQDASLQADLKLYKSIKGTLKEELAPDEADAKFKATLNQFNQEHFKQKQQKATAKIFAFSKVWYAAAVLVIGLLVWAPWNTSLYDQYADTEMVSFAERGSNAKLELEKATEAFNSENFEVAKSILTQQVKNDPENDMLRFYLGVAQLEANVTDSARLNLTHVAGKQSILKYDATFYMALSYLKKKDKKECRVWLNKIPKEASVYEKAQELLKAL